MRTLCVAVLAVVACGESPSGDEARVAPLDLVMDNRVVLTPGHSVTIPVRIVRAEPEPEHPVQLALTGGGGAGVFVSLDTTNTKENLATLSIAATATATEQEVSYVLDGHLGPYRDGEALVVSVQLPDPTAATTEEYAPGVTGVWKSLTIEGQEMPYEVIDGVAIVGGDIVLGNEQEVLARLQLRTATCNPSFHTDFACSAWTDGVIGYSFANNWGSDSENARMRGLAMTAMAEWTRQTGIRFVPRTGGERVQFEDGDGCSAGIGRVVLTGLEPQKVSVNNSGCEYGQVLHEIGHAIGLYHEQMRNDRGNHVEIFWDRIKFDKLGNFFQIGDFLVDRGDYDYDSIMHYEPWAFSTRRSACEDEGDLTACTILPTNPATAAIGQRDHLSEGDIYGVYKLYPPIFSIGGATNGQTDDQFRLFVDYDRGRPGVDRITWTSDRVATPLGTGNVLELRADQVPSGIHVITASFIVRGEVIRSRSITLNVHNAAPALTLVTADGRTNQDVHRAFSVIVSIDDEEDGFCDGCAITWDPVPTTGQINGRAANYTFHTEGPQTITVTVEDHAGGRSTTSLELQIVNSPPVATIFRPTPGFTVAENSTVRITGQGTDPNTGPLACSRASWSSSDPADTFPLGTVGCDLRLRVAGPGPRTLTLAVTDGVHTSTTTLSFTVSSSACTAAGCPPSAFFTFDASHRPDGVYVVENEIYYEVSVGDREMNNPITYRLYVRRTGTTTMTAISDLESQTVHDPDDVQVRGGYWTPDDSIGSWTNCVVDYRDYDIILEATDSSGMTTRYTRTFSFGCDLI